MAQAGQLREAEPHLAELMIHPEEDGPEICEAFINGFLLAYRFGDAARLLDVWQADFPDDPQAHYIRGMLATSSGDNKNAVASLRLALRLAPHRKDIRQDLADLLVTLHEFGEAEQLFRKSLQNDSENPELLIGLGTCLVERGDMLAGRQAFERALRKAPNLHTARLALGRLELKLDHASEAITLLSPLATERAYDSAVRFSLALALQAAGRSDEAKEHFQFVDKAQRAIDRMQFLMDEAKKKTDDAEVRYQIGMICLKYESPTNGVKWLLSVLNLQPDHQPTHAALAQYYRSLGNERLAVEHERQAGDVTVDISD
ncbi:MAG: tetratricopeptide repeat protein [Planctomycetales bacterium]|nr:tetratricopeptide repeat protein [Planctomycetales bacterium]